MGPWLTGAQEASITDYDATQDRVYVFYDKTEAAPVVTTSDTGSDVIVLADGVEITRVVGASGNISASDIIVRGTMF